MSGDMDLSLLIEKAARVISTRVLCVDMAQEVDLLEAGSTPMDI